MAVLEIINEEKPSSGIIAVQLTPPSGLEDGSPRSYITNNEVAQVMRTGQAYHFPNKLVLNFIPSDDDEFLTIFHPDMSVPLRWAFDVFFRDKVSTPSGLERDTFGVVTYGRANNVTLTNNGATAEITFADDLQTIIEDRFARLGKTRPAEGFMYIKFQFLQEGREETLTTSYFVIKVSFSPVFDFEFAPFEPEQVFIESEITTKPLAFESLYVPVITGSFVYNRYEIDEDSLLAARRRNYNLKDLKSIPKYIRLTWSPAPIVTKPIRFAFAGGIVARQDPPESTGRRQSPEDARRLREQRDAALKQLRSGFDIQENLLGSNTGSSSASSFLGLPPEPPPENDIASRKQPEEQSNTVSYGGNIWSVRSEQEEESEIISSKTRTGDQAQRGTPRSASPPSNPNYVGEDSTVSLGLPEEEDLILKNLIKDKDNPDTIVGPNDYSRYVGYILLKERFNTNTARFEPIDMIGVLDRRKIDIIDTKVAYGDIYRYKIRSVFKFVNVDDLPLFRDQDTVFSGSLSASLRSVFDGGTPFRFAFYFDSKYSSPIEVTAVENVRPDPPENINIYPNSIKKNIFITWNQKQQQKDVLGFNVYRREDTPDSFFTKLNTELLELRNNFYIDFNLEVNKKYIYAVESVDQHDNFSKLSIQKKASVREFDFEAGRVENPVEIHLNREIELNEKLFDDMGDIIKFNDKLRIAINPLYTNVDRSSNYLLKIKSIDSFQEKEIKLNFTTKIITHTGSVSVSDDVFEERKQQIIDARREQERVRLGLTEEEMRRRERREREFEE